MNNTSVCIEDQEPPDLPPDKFKTPIPRYKSAFKPISQTNNSITSKFNSMQNNDVSKMNSIYLYNKILKKALAGNSEITPDEKMILWNHPVIVELIKQTKVKNMSTVYILIESIINYHYFNASKVPILYDPKKNFKIEDQVMQYSPPQDEEASTDSTKWFSYNSLISEEDLTKTIGKYTIFERREKIRRYKLKLQRYKFRQNNQQMKYHKRSVIAKTKPRLKGKFAKISQQTNMTETHEDKSILPC